MTGTTSKPDFHEQTVDPPPFFRTWRRLYLAVIGWLLLLILLFHLFARRFAG